METADIYLNVTCSMLSSLYSALDQKLPAILFLKFRTMALSQSLVFVLFERAFYHSSYKILSILRTTV